MKVSLLWFTDVESSRLKSLWTNVFGSPAVTFDRFFINLLCGESESSDIALHFNPRFDSRDRVVFNSCQNGSWQSEEKIHRMPFHKDHEFEMVITAFSHGYEVYVFLFKEKTL